MSFSSLSDICANRSRSLDRDLQVARVSIEDSNQPPNMRRACQIPIDGAAALEFKKCIDIAFPILELLRNRRWRRAWHSTNENMFIPSEIESSIAGVMADKIFCSRYFSPALDRLGRELI
jgi:hypothetical protein